MTQRELESILEKNQNVIVDFYATWCGPCKMLSPIFEELEKEYKNIKFVKINVDESSEVSQNFNVRSIPTVFFFKAKKNVSNFLGFRPKNEIVKIIEKVLSK